MPSKLFGTFGVRGIYGTELNPEDAMQIGSSLATYLGHGKTIVVGYDPRTSSVNLESALVAGILSCGCNVKRVGMVPTPVLSYATPRLGGHAGVMITASHNPPEYNGIKLWNKDGSGFQPQQDRKIESIYSKKKFAYAAWNKLGRTMDIAGVNRRYINDLEKKFDSKVISKAKLRIVVDPGNGAASEVTPTLLRKLGCEIIELNSLPDGTFPGRNPNPNKPENLKGLMKAVKQHSAVLGIAHDGDADRTIFIDEKGGYVMGDRSFALACVHKLKSKAEGTIVAPIATSAVIEDAAKRVSSKIIWTPVGEPFVVAKMQAIKADIGGEENGGIVYPEWVWTREGIATSALIIEMIAQTQKSFSQLNNELPIYAQQKHAIKCPNEKKIPLMTWIKENVPTGFEIQDIDGIKLISKDGWILMRPSGTEAVFRIFSESTNSEKAKALLKNGLKIVQTALKSI